MSFQISPELDANKVFLVRSSELEGRLDPFCYVPELVQLDRKIKSKTRSCLKDFTLFRASGATPKKDAEDYYSDEKNGIPFIRVQNLSVTGELDTRDLVYISKDVHEGMLKRSQIKANDLLVKITGVGRMAVASVVPDGFEGNINQHIVVIRTDSKETSQNLAAFLNLDSVEKIASKRATGGTRPALDYAALFSIPVINRREIYEIIHKAVSLKREKEAEAQRLLDSIDDYLLGELGIELPEQEENTVQSRIFIRRFSEISGGRLDPYFHKPYFYNILENINRTCFEIIRLGKISSNIINGYDCREYINSGTMYLRVSNIKKNVFSLENTMYINADGIEKDVRLKKEDLLITRKGSYGIAAIANESVEGSIISSEIFKVSLHDTVEIKTVYLSEWLNSKICQTFFRKIQSGAIMGHLSKDALITTPVILPPLQKQAEIADHITLIRSRAKQLQQEAKEGLEQAKQEVEAVLLGDA